MKKKVLFASDLDQTLLYSRRMLPQQGMDVQVLAVEKYEGRYISFVTEKLLHLLRDISRTALFVPVTTRTKLQYQRIQFPDDTLSPRYAVTSNGGTVFFEGVEDEEWKRLVLREARECLAVGDLLQKFAEIRHPSWVAEESGKLADGLFYYCLIERDKIPQAELGEFQLWAGKNNWEVSVQGRKLYLVPRNVSKKAAIQYIREKESLDFLAAAGDSLLDLAMLQAADFALAPAHGELYALYDQGEGGGLEQIKFTQKSGIEAGEEILECVKKWIFADEIT